MNEEVNVWTRKNLIQGLGENNNFTLKTTVQTMTTIQES